MKALAYQRAHPLEAFAIELVEVAEPVPRDADLVVEVGAVGVNPGETRVRRTRSADPGGRVVLGWELAGVVVAVGPAVSGFSVGDRVLGTGDPTRDGCWAERVAIDHRVVARVPDTLSLVDAASLPIGGVTAWEALFREGGALPAGVDRVLVVGGAGGVGSLATQLLATRTSATVICTASRPESQRWCTTMGADLVVDHGADVPAALRSAGIEHVDMVLSTAGTAANLAWIAPLLRPHGHLAAVDLDGPLDLGPLVLRSVSVHTEMVFNAVVHGEDPSAQGRILHELAADAAAGRLRPITTTRLQGLSAQSMRAAHQLLESRRTIGKVVIAT
ncbi:zinc-binding alcohol dehydrogenase family protein [Auraticoccus monumenti]|uniref:Zinc-type alcohol dehydrogenase-like protein n=1 Tax=Auraticoccus monumenti TaxID=675864 RepID=A0A1G6TQS3_9ACTN|nr:zinc-binding alcohol dehydrogenase family protein [Auraticoccus monumenti]SDD31401.1 zinc-binding alcohol dehydrogenase family protein [Auraticoccus monumenti]